MVDHHIIFTLSSILNFLPGCIMVGGCDMIPESAVLRMAGVVLIAKVGMVMVGPAVVVAAKFAAKPSLGVLFSNSATA